jgi:hypothetical protein
VVVQSGRAAAHIDGEPFNNLILLVPSLGEP